MWNQIWASLGSKQGLVLLGFLLSSVLGGLLTYAFQRLSWRRQAKLELYSQRYRDGNEFLDRLSSLIDRRYFALVRLLWAVQENASSDKYATRERAYFKTVVEWNDNLRAMHNRVRILVGEEKALAFLDYEDDYRQDDPRSLHYRFVAAHRALTAAKDDRAVVDKAQLEANKLNWCLSSFLFDVTTVFAERANSLALLQFPDAGPTYGKTRQISGPPAQLRSQSQSAQPAPGK